LKKIYISHSVQFNNVGLYGYNEAKNCMDIANRLYGLLRGTNGVQAYICTQEMKLDQIIQDSNSKNVDLHLAIHSNAGPSEARGTETFCIPGGEAEKAARVIHANVVEAMKSINRGVKNGKHLKELNSTKAPAVLIELGFHTNEDDVKQLLYCKNNIAAALYQGVIEYFNLKINWEQKVINDALVKGVITERRIPYASVTWAEFLAVLQKLNLF